MNPKNEPAFQLLQACESFSQRDRDMILLGLIYHSASLTRRELAHTYRQPWEWELNEIQALEKLEKTYNFKIQ